MDVANLLKPTLRIKINSLLRGGEKTLAVDEVLALRQLALLGKKANLGMLNLGEVSEVTIRNVERRYGPAGLFQLVGLAMSTSAIEFKHFMGILDGEDAFRTFRETLSGASVDLRCDNHVLKASPKVKDIAVNVFQPSLSRKLYRAGRHHGSLVYGVGGPRILVSHVFHGVAHETYDLYTNTLDVVTSLQMRGFDGTFHFLDLMPGLEAKFKGIPGWLAWFAIIAIHSDLVLFVQEQDAGLRPAQKLEADYTPDSVQKVIVSIPRSELKWAKDTTEHPNAETMYLGEHGVMTKDEWYAMEAEHALPFIENYVGADFPRDRLFQIAENGAITQYPLDYPRYTYDHR
jgi:hypothetical protein